MKSREISRSKIGPFSLACTDPYRGIGWESQSNDRIPLYRLAIHKDIFYLFITSVIIDILMW